MARHRAYSAIVAAARSGQLVEPFSQSDFRTYHLIYQAALQSLRLKGGNWQSKSVECST